MEISTFSCFPDLGMGDPFAMHQWPHMDTIDDLSSISMNSSFSEDYTFDAYPSYPIDNHDTTTSHQPMLDFKRSSHASSLVEDYNIIRPSKQMKSVNGGGGLPPPESVGFVKPKEERWHYSSGTSLNFSSPESVINQSRATKVCRGSTKESSATGANGTRLSQDHIMAERKRREKLSQRFIALSTLVPGLKKMDKASILGDAINHIKQLEEKVKALEEQARKKIAGDAAVFAAKRDGASKAESGENSSAAAASDDQSISSGPSTAGEPLPAVEARFCGQEVLVSIHCERRKGALERAVGEIEKLHLSVVNSSLMTFGDSALDITVVAQKDEEFNMNMKDLVKQLWGALKISDISMRNI